MNRQTDRDTHRYRVTDTHTHTWAVASNPSSKQTNTDDPWASNRSAIAADNWIKELIWFNHSLSSTSDKYLGWWDDSMDVPLGAHARMSLVKLLATSLYWDI